MKFLFKKHGSCLLMFLLTCLFMAIFSACGNDNISKDSEVDDVIVRVGSLKGPTSIGLVNLMKSSESDNSIGKYEFTMEAQADILLASMTKGDLDIALVPANVASILYNKTEGGIKVIDINTLGVLYMLSADTSISDITDLKGKTICLMGMGTTPDLLLQYILRENGIDNTEVTIEYMSEAQEVLAAISSDSSKVGILPQPFATAAGLQNENVKEIFDMTKLWNQLQGDGGAAMVTGVTIVRSDFLNEHKAAVDNFMALQAASVETANSEVEATAELVAEYGIIEKAAVAAKAIPKCNIAYIDGAEMKEGLSAYLSILSEFDPSFIGGNLPDEEFYYIAE